jgi:probable F420-dependent oxidoreductase
MRIGVFSGFASPVATPEYIETFARGAEERGFAEIWVAEHVVLFDEHASPYPYDTSGRFPITGEAGLLDPFPTLGLLAAVTERIRIGTGICLVPQRNPVYTAKQVATTDWLSNGRFDFGVGVGWLAEEFAALGAPFDHRGSRTVEYLEVMKSLWCDEVSSYRGRFYSLPECRQYPKPVQSPHPPIYFGGESDAALERVARIGQGWYGFGLAPDATAAHVKQLEQLLAPRNRSRAEVDVVISPYLLPTTRDDVARYHEAGVDQLVLLAPARDRESIPALLDHLVSEYLEPAASLGRR